MSNKVLTRQDLATAYFASDSDILCHQSSEGLSVVGIHVEKPGVLNDVVPVWIAYSHNSENIYKPLVLMSILRAYFKEGPEKLKSCTSASCPDSKLIPIDFNQLYGLQDEELTQFDCECQGEKSRLGILTGNGYRINKDDMYLIRASLYILLLEIGPIDPFLKAILREFKNYPPKVIAPKGFRFCKSPDLSRLEPD